MSAHYQLVALSVSHAMLHRITRINNFQFLKWRRMDIVQTIWQRQDFSSSKKKTVLQILCNETSTDFSLCIFTRWRSLISSAVFLALVTRLKQRRWWYTGLIKLVGPIRCCYQMDTCMLMKVPSCTHCKRFWNETSQTSVATLHPTSTVHDLKCAW